LVVQYIPIGTRGSKAGNLKDRVCRYYPQTPLQPYPSIIYPSRDDLSPYVCPAGEGVGKQFAGSCAPKHYGLFPERPWQRSWDGPTEIGSGKGKRIRNQRVRAASSTGCFRVEGGSGGKKGRLKNKIRKIRLEPRRTRYHTAAWVGGRSLTAGRDGR